MICYSGGHCRACPQGAVNLNEVVGEIVERDRSRMILNLA
jgi:hypothetical protein